MIHQQVNTRRCLFLHFLSISQTPSEDVNELTLDEFKQLDSKANILGTSLLAMAPGCDDLLTRHRVIDLVSRINPYFKDFFTSEEKAQIFRQKSFYSYSCPGNKDAHTALKKTIQIAEEKLRTDPSAFTFLLDASANHPVLFDYILSLPECHTKHLNPLNLLEPLSTTFQAKDFISRICERHNIDVLPPNLLKLLFISASKTTNIELIMYLIENFIKDPANVLDLIPDEFKPQFLKAISSDNTLFDLISPSFKKDLLSPNLLAEGLCYVLNTNNMTACLWYAESTLLKQADNSLLKTALIRSSRLKDCEIFFLISSFLSGIDEKTIKTVAKATMSMSPRVAKWVIERDGFDRLSMKDPEYSRCVKTACMGGNARVAIELMNYRPLEDVEVLGECLLSSSRSQNAELIHFILALPNAKEIPDCLLDVAFYTAAVTSFKKSSPKPFFTQGIELFIDYWIKSGKEALINHGHLHSLQTLLEEQNDQPVTDILKRLYVFLDTFKTES